MISFIVPTHNYGKYLKRCIFSILKNNPKYIREIIIINDASADNTDNIATSLKQKKLSTSKKNFKNLSKTMNFAIKMTSGNFFVKLKLMMKLKKISAELHYKKFVKLKKIFCILIL